MPLSIGDISALLKENISQGKNHRRINFKSKEELLSYQFRTKWCATSEPTIASDSWTYLGGMCFKK